MRKFPVISESGREYEVRINRWINGSDLTEVLVYAERAVPFGKVIINIMKKVHRVVYNEVEEEYKFVEMAKFAVVKYEEVAQREIRLNEAENENVRKFDEWDGRC